MDEPTRRLVALGAVIAPALHTLTDVLEWISGGFTAPQLWLNYAAFLPVPAVMLGLYAVQRPHISRVGLAGAVGYGIAFVYFAHTTLLAIALHVPTYDQLWDQLGVVYTAHGALMIAGGAAFGWASVRARRFPAWTVHVFLLGIAVNLLLSALPAPELLHTIGTLLRNTGLVGMGIATWRHDAR